MGMIGVANNTLIGNRILQPAFTLPYRVGSQPFVVHYRRGLITCCESRWEIGARIKKVTPVSRIAIGLSFLWSSLIGCASLISNPRTRPEPLYLNAECSNVGSENMDALFGSGAQSLEDPDSLGTTARESNRGEANRLSAILSH